MKDIDMAKEWFASYDRADYRPSKPKTSGKPMDPAMAKAMANLVLEDVRKARELRPLTTDFLVLIAQRLPAEPAPSRGAGGEDPMPHLRALIDNLKNGGFLNDGLPLYDLKDPTVKRQHDDAILKTPAHSSIRDKAGWKDIKAAVARHVAKHGPGTLIVLMGAGVHMYGAVPELEKTAGVRYVSATPLKLKFADIQNPGRKLAGSEAMFLLRNQIDMSIGAVKELGYKNLQSFLAARSLVKKPANIMVGVEETGLHHLYDRFDRFEKSLLFGILEIYVAQARPTSILCLVESWEGEGAPAIFSDERMARFLRNKDRSEGDPWEDFIIASKQLGIPVYLGGFCGDVLGPEAVEALDQFESWLRIKFMPKSAEREQLIKNIAALSRYAGALPGWCRDEDAELEARVLLLVSDYGGPRKLFPSLCKEASAFPVYYPRTSIEMALKLLRKSPKGKRIVDFLIQEKVFVGYAEKSIGVLTDGGKGVIRLSLETMAYDPLEKALLIAHEGWLQMRIKQGGKPSETLETSAENAQTEVYWELIRAGVPPLLRLRMKGRRQVKAGPRPAGSRTPR
ncbi:MAG: hypothetical protein HY748_06975 [Elusimicrobia bacterium]|nr:hypothetical protein [Elusimicrobiota bacterium]